MGRELERNTAQCYILDGSKTNPRLKLGSRSEDFINDRLGPSALAATVNLLNAEQIAHIEEIINNNIDAEVRFSDTANRAIEEMRRGPQLGFVF